MSHSLEWSGLKMSAFHFMLIDLANLKLTSSHNLLKPLNLHQSSEKVNSHSHFGELVRSLAGELIPTSSPFRRANNANWPWREISACEGARNANNKRTTNSRRKLLFASGPRSKSRVSSLARFLIDSGYKCNYQLGRENRQQ